jgi:hypothetical protein
MSANFNLIAFSTYWMNLRPSFRIYKFSYYQGIPIIARY